MYSQAEPGSDYGYGWRDPVFHGMLVIQTKNLTTLYNWSYLQKKWTYLKPGFAKRASIDEPEIVCNPQADYLQQIPWIFP